MCRYIRLKPFTLFPRILIKMIIVYHRQFNRERLGIPIVRKKQYSLPAFSNFFFLYLFFGIKRKWKCTNKSNQTKMTWCKWNFWRTKLHFYSAFPVLLKCSLTSMCVNLFRKGVKDERHSWKSPALQVYSCGIQSFFLFFLS